METIPAKSILARVQYPDWFGVDYNMNLYRGCSHGCIYCDSRSACYHNADFDRIKPKEEAIALLRGELKGRLRPGVVHSGSMSDPYNPLERDLTLTRQALALLAQHGFGFVAATKGTLVLRDIDLLQRVQAHAPVLINITITAAADDLAARIEPHAPPSSARFDALEKLSAAGIPSGVLLMPVLPFLTDTPDNLRRIVHRAADCGAIHIYGSAGVTVRTGQREYFFAQLDAIAPGVKAQYARSYGNAYQCSAPNAEALMTILAEACEARGLYYRMPDIIAAYQGRYANRQISLFDL